MRSQRVAEAANEAVKKEIDALRAEVVRLADLVADLAKSSSDLATRNVQETVDRARGRASEAMDRARGTASDAMERAKGTASDLVDRARGKASDAADALVSSGRQAAGEVSRRVEPLTAELAASVERNPMSALLVAAGLGLLAGLFIRQGK